MKEFSTKTERNWLGRIKAVTKTPVSKKDKTIISGLVNEFKDITRTEIKAWRSAIQAAMNPENPRWFLLQDIYDNLETDGHYKNVRGLRRAAVLSKKFMIVDKDGKEDIEKTTLLKKKWFFDLLKLLLDNIYKGYSVIELVSIEPIQFKLVPRRNCDPTNTRIYMEVGGDDFIDYSDPSFASRILSIVNTEEYGLINDIVPQLIWKKNAQQVWADFSERFGIPLVTAETMETDVKKIDKIEEMLSQLGQAAQAVLPEGTKITIHDQVTKGDPHNIFNEQVKTTNAEISKRVVGGTMITDDGSSQSQANVHQNNLDTKIAYEDRTDLEFMVTDCVLPLLNSYGFNFSEDDQFIFDKSESLSLSELWKIVNDANKVYDIPIDYITRTFNIPIDGLKKQTSATGGGLTANFQ
jgi:phage gp29-like protein